MNAVPPSMIPGAAGSRWAALRETGEVVAALAGIEPGEAPDFRGILRQAPEWRRELAEQTAADVAAALQPGLCGLGALALRGADPRPAARALWDEFLLAQEAVLAVATSGGTARGA